MGVRQLESIASRLMAVGRAASEPAAVVERGTLPDAAGRAWARWARSRGGGVARACGRRRSWSWARSRRWRSGWPGSAIRPLAGLTVAVTRARAQASGLAARLRSLGASVVEAPAIRIVPLDGPAPDVAGYDLVCLTSPNGVRLLFARLAAAGLDARALAGARVAAIGPGTARALSERGVVADVVPERFVAEGLVEALADVPVTRALVARAAEARDVLLDALRERGAEVDVVALYETVAAPLDEAQLAAVAAADYVTFTSSSTVRFFLESAAWLAAARAVGQHRSGDQRDPARARARARRRGDAARHRRRWWTRWWPTRARRGRRRERAGHHAS